MALRPSDEAAAELLQQRARTLAKLPASEVVTESVLAVCFSLGDHKYGIDAKFVKEIRMLESLTPVPCTPEFVAGIVNIRGALYSLIDLRRFMEVTPRGVTDLTQIIIVAASDLEVGVLADRVSGMNAIPQTAIKPPLPNDENVAREFIHGVTPDLTVLLNIEKLFSHPGMIVYEEVKK
ncbi:MAG TPA: chemotaxis protein CheW [Actinomycetota bacterium]|nr:chemotaxis protein CheW [Actinomycetota bacterium]